MSDGIVNEIYYGQDRLRDAAQYLDGGGGLRQSLFGRTVQRASVFLASPGRDAASVQHAAAAVGAAAAISQ